MTSISCNETVWTTSLRFCSSPSGHWTNLVWRNGYRKHGGSPLIPLFHAYICCHGVVVTGTGEGTTDLCDPARSLVNMYHIARHHLFLVESINHFVAQVVNSFHISRFERQLARFRALKDGKSFSVLFCVWMFKMLDLRHSRSGQSGFQQLRLQ